MTPVGFEPTPLRNGALSHRLRPLGQSVLSYTTHAGVPKPDKNNSMVWAHVKRATLTILWPWLLAGAANEMKRGQSISNQCGNDQFGAPHPHNNTNVK